MSCPLTWKQTMSGLSFSVQPAGGGGGAPLLSTSQLTDPGYCSESRSKKDLLPKAAQSSCCLQLALWCVYFLVFWKRRQGLKRRQPLATCSWAAEVTDQFLPEPPKDFWGQKEEFQ